MDTKFSANRKFTRMFANILSIVAILAIAFPAMGSVSAQETALPEGWHDGVEGSVNAASCGAFGWAVDPDDRDRDLQVQILADGSPIVTTTADLLREDVAACTGGTCGFGVDLWGLISPGIEHLISVQAYDQEADAWVDLSGTPKAITCWGYPEGFHDGNEGVVDVNSCSAFGWAADPDDRNRDLQVQIFADGSPIATTTADLLREDVGACTDGTCGFGVDLWELISPDEEHQITAQSFDEETNVWMNLEATPKSLTCLTPPPNPFIAVSLSEHWFWINYFTPETLVTFYIYENQDDESPILEFSKPTDASGNLTIEGWEHIWDPEPGDYIVATDGSITKDLVLEYITLDEFDYENDFLSGEAAYPGRSVDIGVGNENGEQWMKVTADGNSRWEADFMLPDYVFDITENSWAGAHVNDEDGDVTAAHNSGPPEPPAWFTVFPEWDAIEGWNFPLGAVVHLAIDDPLTEEDSPDYEQYETVTFTPWGSWELWVWFEFAGKYDVKAGDVVTLTYGETVRTHIVQNLVVTKVNPEDNVVKGIADAGANVNVWPHATGQEQLAIANPQGKWNVDFTGIYDLMPGDGGRARIWDEMGNATELDWYIPKSRIVASITEDWFYLQEFSPNTTLNFTVYEAQDEKPIWQGTATTDSYGFAWIDAEGRWNLEPGNYLVVKDGRNSKDLVIEGFTFDIFNITNGQLSGTAPEPYGRRVWVGIGWENDGWSMDVATDETGSWNAEFGQLLPSNYQWVAAQIFDDDGDASELRPASQIIFLRPSCGDTYTVQAGSLLEIRYGSWVAIGEDLANQNAEHLTVELVLNGETVTGTQQPVVPRSEIPCGSPLEDAYGVFYVTQLDSLSAGIHVASVTWILDEEVTDGYDANGDGEPDWYGPGEVFTHEFTIIVQ